MQAEGISYAYGERQALDGLTLAIPAGSVFGLLGPNGSGKSTFVSLLSAMEPPASGSLRVFSEAPTSKLRARVGTVFQENTQDPLLTPLELLSLAGSLFGIPRGLLRTRSMELLATFGLAGRENDAISSLSGGMRRRLDMARALLHDPELLILDEPTTGVDPGERQALWAALLGKSGGNRTILLATNDLGEADTVCDAIAFLRAGAVVVSGRPADLKAGLRRESLIVEWTEPSPSALERLARAPGAGNVTVEGETVQVMADDAAAIVPLLFEIAPGAIRSVRIRPATLEDAYFQYVGRRADAVMEAMR
ncbi:hypothetical protein AYO38_05105 [bacterium SCGC AG-212-C10]|nr:hypothetical protein AYO38_05105 [bacterium SCGC AG-212-C10]